jgi:hypothetical protein
MDNIEVVKIDADSFEIRETIPEKTVVVPEAVKVTSYNLNDLKQDIAMQEGVVADKTAELQEAQNKLDKYNALLEQGTKAEISVEALPVEVKKP